MKKIMFAILVSILSGCVSTSQQSTLIEVDDPLHILILHDSLQQEFATSVYRQMPSNIQVNQQSCEMTCEIEGHPDLIIAIGPQINTTIDTAIPLLRVFDHEANLIEKITFLKENSNYQNLVTIDFKIEGIEMLKSDSKLQENIKKHHPDALLLQAGQEELKVDVPVVLSQHPQNVVEVIVDEAKTIEEIKQMSTLILKNQGYQEKIPLFFKIR